MTRTPKAAPKGYWYVDLLSRAWHAYPSRPRGGMGHPLCGANAIWTRTLDNPRPPHADEKCAACAELMGELWTSVRVSA